MLDSFAAARLAALAIACAIAGAATSDTIGKPLFGAPQARRTTY